MSANREPHIKTPNKSGAYLKGLRLERGATREEVAQAIGRNADTVGRYERFGLPAHIRIGVVWNVCNYYGISADELLMIATQPA